MTTDQLYSQYKGTSIPASLTGDKDPSDNGQCFIWFDLVLNQRFNLPFFHADGAIDIWLTPGSLVNNFTLIPYSPNMQILKDDIVVYGAGVGSKFGHVSIAAQNGIGSNYVGYDSNWGDTAKLATINHNDKYNSAILGVLRLKGSEAPVFNEGDRENINIGLFGYDAGLFKTAVGTDWKTAIYAILQSSDFKNLNEVNQGDVDNIDSVLGGDASSALGKVWKQAVYDYILKNAGGNFTPVSGTLYTKDA